MSANFGAYFRAQQGVSLLRSSICFVFWAAVFPAIGTAQPAVVVTPNPLIFPTLQVQSASTQSVTVTNSGTADLILSDIRITPVEGPFSLLYQPATCNYPPGASIPPGGNCTIQIQFYPTSIGQYNATISITDNASDSPQSIPVNGTAVPYPNLTLQTIAPFYTQKILTQSTPQGVTLSNLTTGPADNLTFSITGANPNDFLVGSQCSSSLPQYTSCIVSVVFFPQMIGSRAAVLNVASDEGSLSVPLNGTSTISGTFDIVNSRSGKALDLADGSASAGTSIEQNALSGLPQQRWSLVPTDSGFYKIVNAISGRVLDVTAESTADGALIQEYDYVGGENQQWEFVPVDDVHFRIVNRLSGKVLDVTGGSTADGTAIQQWDYLGDPQQLWVLLPTAPYNITNTLSSNVLDTAGGSNDDGTPVQQSSPAATKQQQWQLFPVGAGYYAILNVFTGKVLDVTAESTANGAPIQEWDYLGGANQQWQIVPVSPISFGNYVFPYAPFTVEIVNRLSGKVLDDTGSSAVSGTVLQQWDYLGNSNQQWQFAALPSYLILSGYNGLALDVPGGSTADGTPIQQWGVDGFLQQQWQLIPVGSLFAIINSLTGKALEVQDSSEADGALIDQSTPTAAANQLWKLTTFYNYVIVNEQSGKVLDDTGFSRSNGTLMQQWDNLGGVNQDWVLMPVSN